MGGKRDTQPAVGAQTQVAVQPQTTPDAPQAAIGKTTLAKYPGIANGGGYCVEHTGKNCFLTSEQRQSLHATYSGYVAMAYASFNDAVSMHEVLKLLENDNQIPILVNIICGVIAGNCAFALQQAFKSLSAAGKNVASAGVEIAEQEAVLGLEAVSEQEVNLILSKTVESAHGAIKPAVAAGVNGVQRSDKDAAESFLELVRLQGNATFKRLMIEPWGYATDSELLGLFVAFDPELHSFKQYKDAIGGQIERYLKSPARQIGRRYPEQQLGTITETRVAWLIRRDGSRQLFYAEREFRDRGGYTSEAFIPPAYFDGHALSLADDTTWNGGGFDNERRHEQPLREDQLVKFVEPEFRDIALARHDATWAVSPETFTFDYSVMPPKLVEVSR